METPKDLRYSIDHEWVLVEGDEAIIGITDYAQEALGEIVYVDLPSEGDLFSPDDTFGEVESVKSVSELIMPIAGEVIAVNDALTDSPELVNSDPYDDGWLIRVRMEAEEDLTSLLTAEAYEASLEK